jgi:enediyne biosynthesis protein E7
MSAAAQEAGHFPRLSVAQVRAAFSSCPDAAGWLELHRRYGDTMWLPGGGLLSNDLAFVTPMLMERPHAVARGIMYRFAGRLFPGAEGLLFQTNPIWKQQLSAVGHVFHRNHLSKVALKVDETIRRHATQWAGAGHIPDLYTAMSRLGADVALRALFGIDGAVQPGRRISDLLAHYKLETMKHEPHARHDRADATLGNLLMSLAANAITLLSLERDVRALDRSLRKIDPDALDGCVPGLAGLAPSRKSFACWFNHLYGAYNATDYTNTFALVYLERYPHLRREIEAEIEGVATREPSPELFKEEMPALRNFMHEVFRVAPAANMVMREVAVPFTARGLTLQPGTQIGLAVKALHNDKRYWDHPERFDPSRWANGAVPHPPCAFIPFLAGPRRCWGRPMAEMVVMQTLREILSRYSVRVLTPDVQPTHYWMPRFNEPVRAEVRWKTQNT